VPTVMESGVPDYEIAGWFGMLAPAGTPPAIAQRLRDEIARAVSTPDMAEQFARQGMAPVGNQPGEFARHLQAELDRWTQVIKDAGIKPE